MTGLPPVWKPLNEPTQLTADAGEYFRDQNAARYPKHPMEPAVRAVLAQNESLQTRDVDIFACSSTLGNLLRFVRRGEYKPFRFVVEKVGKTVFFIRRENAPDEKLQDVKGYGHTFPEAYTEWKKEVAGSESHQRIISYAFGGQKFLVRSETDGYLEGAVAAEHIKSKSFSIDPSLHNPDALAMQKGGLEIPQGAIFDIKTRTLHKKGQNHLADQIGRLWINQTPNFILAFHDQGKFTDIQVQDIKPEVEKWERDKVEGLAGFAGLINRIVHFVRLLEAGRCEVRCQEQGILELREAGPDTGHALPAALAQRWAGERESSSDEAAGEEVAENEESSDPMWSDDDSEKDYTACSAEDCGYCGHCKY